MRKIAVETKRCILSGYFVISVLLTIVVCMTGSCMVEGGTDEIFSLFFQMNRQEMLQDPYCNAYELWCRGIGKWMYVLMPFVLGMSYTVNADGEKRMGNARFFLVREGRKGYCFSRMVSCMVSGGVCMVIGYAVFGVLVAMRFPLPSAYETTMLQEYMDLAGVYDFRIEIIKRIFGAFFYGMASNIFVYISSVLFMDKYVLMSFPMMAAYIYNGIINQLESWCMSSEMEKPLKALQMAGFDTIINGRSLLLKGISFLYILIIYITVYKIYCVKINKDGE